MLFMAPPFVLKPVSNIRSSNLIKCRSRDQHSDILRPAGPKVNWENVAYRGLVSPRDP